MLYCLVIIKLKALVIVVSEEAGRDFRITCYSTVLIYIIKKPELSISTSSGQPDPTRARNVQARLGPSPKKTGSNPSLLFRRKHTHIT